MTKKIIIGTEIDLTEKLKDILRAGWKEFGYEKGYDTVIKEINDLLKLLKNTKSVKLK